MKYIKASNVRLGNTKLKLLSSSKLTNFCQRTFLPPLHHIKQSPPRTYAQTYSKMPVAIGHILSIIIFGSAFAGSIADYCRNHPGPGCVRKRDILLKMARADVGPCNVPQYNFDMCRDQIKGQVEKGIKIWTSIPSQGSKCFSTSTNSYLSIEVHRKSTADSVHFINSWSIR